MRKLVKYISIIVLLVLVLFLYNKNRNRYFVLKKIPIKAYPQKIWIDENHILGVEVGEHQKQFNLILQNINKPFQRQTLHLLNGYDSVEPLRYIEKDDLLFFLGRKYYAINNNITADFVVCNLKLHDNLSTPNVKYTTNNIWEVAISPDGNRVVYDRNTTQFMASLWLVDLQAKTEKPIYTTYRSTVFSPVFSPDGKYLAFIYSETEGSQYDPHLGILSLNNSTTIKQSKKLCKAIIEEILWSNDSASILYTPDYTFPRSIISNGIYEYNLKAGNIKCLYCPGSPFIILDIGQSPSGKLINYTSNGQLVILKHK